jgi:hypothetical protein
MPQHTQSVCVPQRPQPHGRVQFCVTIFDNCLQEGVILKKMGQNTAPPRALGREKKHTKSVSAESALRVRSNAARQNQSRRHGTPESGRIETKSMAPITSVTPGSYVQIPAPNEHGAYSSPLAREFEGYKALQRQADEYAAAVNQEKKIQGARQTELQDHAKLHGLIADAAPHVRL